MRDFKNILFSPRPSLVFTVNIPKKSSVIAAHILPEFEGADWNLEAEAKIVR